MTVDSSNGQVIPRRNLRHDFTRGFTMVEILVVLAIIIIVVAMLMPALARAKQQSVSTQCKSNLRQIGVELRIYADANRGWWFPPDLGVNVPPPERWGVHVFKPANAHPPVMTCPADFEPIEDHSYVLNYHLADHKIKSHSTKSAMGGKTPSEVILAGEKVTSETDYYMAVSEFDRVVEKNRHGRILGSNYLYIDSHVDAVAPSEAQSGIDPWDLPTLPNP
jgi:prepilin-type N-terminal cleavage/methylation domain-containing protein